MKLITCRTPKLWAITEIPPLWRCGYGILKIYNPDAKLTFV